MHGWMVGGWLGGWVAGQLVLRMHGYGWMTLSHLHKCSCQEVWSSLSIPTPSQALPALVQSYIFLRYRRLGSHTPSKRASSRFDGALNRLESAPPHQRLARQQPNPKLLWMLEQIPSEKGQNTAATLFQVQPNTQHGCPSCVLQPTSNY